MLPYPGDAVVEVLQDASDLETRLRALIREWKSTTICQFSPHTAAQYLENLLEGKEVTEWPKRPG